MLPKDRRPTHPGEIIRYEYLEPFKMTQQHQLYPKFVFCLEIRKTVRKMFSV